MGNRSGEGDGLGDGDGKGEGLFVGDGDGRGRVGDGRTEGVGVRGLQSSVRPGTPPHSGSGE
ncbi:MAG: hypothetical protein ACRDKW_08220 [Actinomycetota bacterium]